MFPAVSTCSEEMLLRAHLNYAEALLGVGDYVNGFRELDWRLTKRDPLQSPWNGSDPAGKTILVVAEQGLGDTFFFVRYAQELKRLGAKVILLVQRPLKKLLSS